MFDSRYVLPMSFYTMQNKKRGMPIVVIPLGNDVFVLNLYDSALLCGVSVCLTQFYLSVKRAFNGVLSEAFPMRASNTPFSDFHALDVSS